jgi:hypothetical protein
MAPREPATRLADIPMARVNDNPLEVAYNTHRNVEFYCAYDTLKDTQSSLDAQPNLRRSSPPIVMDQPANEAHIASKPLPILNSGLKGS